MSLSTDLIDQFVTATNDEKKVSTETTVYGKVKKDDTGIKVLLDGNTVPTPAITTVNVEDGQRVSVLIKNHTAMITGNMDDPSIGNTKAAETVKQETLRFETAMGKRLTVDELTAVTGFIDKLITNDITTENISAVKADIEDLLAGTITTDELKAKWAQIDGLDAGFADIITANIGTAIVQHLTSSYAYIRRLEADHGDFKTLVTDKFTANDAVIKALAVNKLDANAVDAKFANIDFANVGEAAIRSLFANTGLIDNLTVGDGMVVSGDLAVVTLNASNIKSGKMTADRLWLKGEDGVYYQLNLNALGEVYVTDLTDEEQQELQNGIHGENIIANSITARHIVADDLTAFGATIANFKIKPPSRENLLTDETSANEVENRLYSHRMLALKNTDMLVHGGKYTLSFECDSLDESINWCLYAAVYDENGTGATREFITEFERIGSTNTWVGTGICPAGYTYGDLYLYRLPDPTPDQHQEMAMTRHVKLEVGPQATSYDPEPGKLYSDVKESPENETRGVYMDTDGQFAVGDGNNYLKFYNDDGTYKLALKTSHIELDSGKTVEETVDDVQSIGKNLFLNSGRLQNAYITSSISEESGVIEDPTAPSGNALVYKWTIDDAHAMLNLDISYLNYENKVKAGDKITVSMYVKFNREITCTPRCRCLFVDSDSAEYMYPTTLNTNWQRLIITAVVTKDANSFVPDTGVLNIVLESNEFKAEAGDVFYFSSPKIELGDKPTAWTWSTESDDTDIRNIVSAVKEDIAGKGSAIENIERLLKGEYDDNEVYIGYNKIRTLINDLSGTESSLHISDGSDKNSKEVLFSETNGQGIIYNFATAVSDVLKGMADDTSAAVELAGRIELKTDELGDAYILIAPAGEGCKLKLTADDVEFINSSDSVAAVLTSDETDSLRTDNVTVDNEFRQTNSIYGSRNLLTKATAEDADSSGTNRKLQVHDSDKLISGKKYTMSFDGKLLAGATSWHLNVNVKETATGNETNNTRFISDFKEVSPGRWVGTGKYPKLPEGYEYVALRLYPYPRNDTGPWHTNSKVKLEEGAKATEFTLAPEDSNIKNGYFVWEVRSNGNYGLSWKGE